MKKSLNLILVFFALSLIFIGCGKTITKHTVKFETFGGSQISEQKIDNSKFASKPNDPTKEGYIFEGWFEDEALENEFNFETHAITSETTIYAKYSKMLLQVNFSKQVGDGFKFIADSSTPLEYGDSFLFKLIISKEYSKSDPIISLNGKAPRLISKTTLTEGENTGKIELAYSFDNLTQGGDIVLAGVRVNTYVINLPSANEQVGYSISASSPVLHNSSATLTFTLNESYSQSENSLKIVVNGENYAFSDLTNGSTLTFNNVTEDLNIQVIGVERNKYSVCAITSNDALISEIKEGASEGFAFSGSDLIVSTTLNKHYTLNSNLVLKYSDSSGSHTLTPSLQTDLDDGGKVFTFTIENVQSNITELSFSGIKKNEYEISFPLSSEQEYNGYSLSVFGSSKTKFEYGDSFKINLVRKKPASYSYSNATLIVYGSDRDNPIHIKNLSEVFSENSQTNYYQYTITEIDQNIYCEVSGIKPITHSFSFPQSELFTITPTSRLFENKILKGDDFKIKITFAEGYEAKSEFKISAGGVELEKAEDNQYTLKNVQNDIELEVTSEYIGKVLYSISYQECEGLSFYEGYQGSLDYSVEHGESFTFTINILPDYSNSFDKFEVAINGNLITEENSCISSISIIQENQQSYQRSYEISGVKSNITISLVGLEKNQITVTLNNQPLNAEHLGFEFIEGGSKPYVNSEYNFKIALKYGYELSEVEAYYEFEDEGKETLYFTEEIINNQKILNFSRLIKYKNLNIIIENVKINTYSISLYNEEEKFSFELISDASQNATFEFDNFDYTFTHGSNALFKLNLTEAYSNSTSFTISLVNHNTTENVEFTQLSNGIYKISNITCPLKLSASGLEINKYNVQFYFCTQSQLNSKTEPVHSEIVNHGSNLSSYEYANNYIRSTSWSSLTPDISISSITGDCDFVLGSYDYVEYDIYISDCGSVNGLEDFTILTLTYEDFGYSFENPDAELLTHYSLESFIEKYINPSNAKDIDNYANLTFKGLFIAELDITEEALEILDEIIPSKTYLIKKDETSGEYVGDGISYEIFNSFATDDEAIWSSLEIFAEFELPAPSKTIEAKNQDGEIILDYYSGSPCAEMCYTWWIYTNGQYEQIDVSPNINSLKPEYLKTLGYESGTYNVICTVYSQMFLTYKYVKVVEENEAFFEIQFVYSTSEVVSANENEGITTPYEMVIN